VWQWQYWRCCGGLKRKLEKKLKKIAVAGWQSTFAWRAAYQVAVAGWQWYRSTEEVKAVRMVLDRGWQWQYWLRWRTNYQCLSHIPSIANLFFFKTNFAQFSSNFSQISSNPTKKIQKNSKKIQKNASMFPISQ
jgi:hypothetical protein